MQVVNVTGTELLPVLSRLVRLLRQQSTAEGLSSVAITVLGRLRREGPHRVTDLARSEATSQPGMTQLVARLEREGLVRRGSDPTDGRATIVEITAAGTRLLTRAEARHAATLDVLLDSLDADDRDVIAAALPALTRMVEQPA